MFIFLSQAVSGSTGGQGNSALFLLILIAAIVGWFALQSGIRRLRARKTEAVVHDAFHEFAVVALMNAARLDISGAEFDPSRLQVAANAQLTKDELVAYLEEKSRTFANEQKVKFLKALLGVLVADGRFDEVEHQALIDYTAAVGFDRHGAPQMLRGLLSDMTRDRIT